MYIYIYNDIVIYITYNIVWVYSCVQYLTSLIAIYSSPNGGATRLAIEVWPSVALAVGFFRSKPSSDGGYPRFRKPPHGKTMGKHEKSHQKLREKTMTIRM